MEADSYWLPGRCPRVRRAVEPEESRWNHSPLLRGLVALPVLISAER